MLNKEMPHLKKGIPHDVDVHVGSRVRLRRAALGLSQDQLGSAIGISFQQVQKYERGANRIGASRLYQMSKALQMPISYFFEGFGDEGLAEDGDSAYQTDPVLKRESLEVMRAYHQIKDPKQRKKILKLIQALAEESRRDSNDPEPKTPRSKGNT
jgi:transcriptional regulator with XRE-family HTH domain